MAHSARVRLLVLVSATTVFGLACKPEEQQQPPPPPECTTDADCTGSLTPCQRHVCAANTCTVAQLPRGTRLEAQVAGDCRASVCGDDGVVTTTNDDSDVPVDGNECTTDACTAGVPSHGNVAADTACGAGGALQCDGAGKCVTCTSATDCAQGSSCQAPACVDGACSLTNLARGTRVGTQTAGDCKASQCDGNGALELATDDADLPVDATSCTRDVCAGGVPSNPAVTAATACSEGDGLVCNGAGACVQCVLASDCPGFDTECNVRTCTAGVCGRRFTADDTRLTSQTANDCKKVVCNGQGQVVTRNDDADLPDDGNACTVDTCSAGVPANTNAAAGATCGSAQVCDGNGGCVGCNTAADCPGTDSECGQRTCVSNTCGVQYADAGVALTTQVPNDCRRVVCNGTGTAVNQNDDADLPVDDGNQCTTQSCSNGVAVFPTRALNTSCSQNGGSFCTAGGQCVACTEAAQCPGSDTACQARSCVANVCGVTFTQAGTVIASQQAGDCKQNQCAGDGGVMVVNLDTDLPADDGQQCTSQRCDNGTPTFPPLPLNSSCTQGGGAVCDAAGACVECNAAAQCGSDTECVTRTCTAGVCGGTNTSSGTALAAQTPNDCQTAVCDGNGGTTAVANATDVPVDDGNECTAEQCDGPAPAHPFMPADTSCGTNGTQFCTATGQCVACNTAAQCGSNGACFTRTCSANACGVSNTSDGTPAGTQTAGDCLANVCDGSGNLVSRASTTDVPNDGNQCTTDTCSDSKPTYTNASAGSACTQSSGSVCDGSGACVACVAPSDCPSPGGECVVPTCSSNTCGTQNRAAGFMVTAQTGGDCKQTQCDGSGATTEVNFDADLPIDNNQCTADVCSAGAGSNPPLNLGTSCNQGGGDSCDGSGACVASPVVNAVAPANAATNVAVSSNIVITFSKAMNPATVTAQTAAGACTGSVQLSRDDFATCLGMTAPLMTAGNTVATFTAAPGLAFGTNYKLRVTTAVADSLGLTMKNQFSMVEGFTTTIDTRTPSSGVVISQVYASGGNPGATYFNDFVELHNRGNATVNVAGYTIQYASNASGSAFAVASTLPGGATIPAGGYYLVRLGSGGSNGAALPTAGATGSTNIGGNGKVALASSSTLVGSTCTGSNLLDLVAGGSASCSEGSSVAASQTATTALIRKAQGCQDTNVNSADFELLPPNPRNATTAPFECSATLNETGLPGELDYCSLQFPTSISATAGAATPLSYARVYEAGTTEGPGASSLFAQIGYGPVTANPQWQPGWTWTNASFNVQVGNDDEYQLSFTAPAAGTYRYGARFSFDGQNWTYCDLNGAGANGGLSFETAQLPTMTVAP